MIERRIGILIANSQFPQEAKIEDLRCPENDVEGLVRVLSDKDRGNFDDLIALKNKPHYEILPVLNKTLTTAKKSDQVLIYYSGHGKLNRAGRLHLATRNSEHGVLESTAISIGRIRELIDVSVTKKIILVLDCCFSGAVGDEFLRLRGDVESQLQMASRSRGTYIMTASTGIQVATEKEADRHGIFTKHLIHGIECGDADLDGDGLITIDELYTYVHERVLEESHQQPMKWNLNVRGDIVIAKSGRRSREERAQRLRELIFELGKEGLPDDILKEALDIIGKEKNELSGEQQAYDDLLERLLQQKIKPLAFMHVWKQIRPDMQTIVKSLADISTSPVSSTKQPEEPIPDNKQTEPQATRPRPGSLRAETETIRNVLGMRFVYIPPGTFMMGSPEDEPGHRKNERQHEVELTQGFYMQTTPVTQGQWQAVMGRNPSIFKSGWEDCPVEGVSWKDVQAFIKKANAQSGGDTYRLPTEAEWEYSCRAGTETAYYTGSTKADLGRAGWYGQNSNDGTHPVGQKEANLFGLYDMHGNIWEWCQDCYSDYPEAKEVTDPKGISEGMDQVVRGGSWNRIAEYCRAAVRHGHAPGSRDDDLGFRLVRLPGR
jgi:formylglycine-generating enzyme required for sulfatase activity